MKCEIVVYQFIPVLISKGLEKINKVTMTRSCRGNQGLIFLDKLFCRCSLGKPFNRHFPPDEVPIHFFSVGIHDQQASTAYTSQVSPWETVALYRELDAPGVSTCSPRRYKPVLNHCHCLLMLISTRFNSTHLSTRSIALVHRHLSAIFHRQVVLHSSLSESKIVLHSQLDL